MDLVTLKIWVMELGERGARPVEWLSVSSRVLCLLAMQPWATYLTSVTLIFYFILFLNFFKFF